MRLSLSHPSVVLLLADLKTGPATVRDLMAALGLSESSVRRVLALLRAQQQVHVVAWERSGGGPRPVFDLGSGADARRPSKLTRTQVQQRFYRRHRAAVLAAQRAYRAAYPERLKVIQSRHRAKRQAEGRA